MYKRVEVDNLKEIQEELIQYDFFKKFVTHGDWSTSGEESHATFSPKNTSAAYFDEIPNLKKLKMFLESVVNTEMISHFYIMNFESKFCSDIHYDIDASWALNIPILNCQDSVTIFYDTNHTEISRITLDVPHFLNVGKCHHQMISHSEKNRLSMSIRFIGDDLDKILK